MTDSLSAVRERGGIYLLFLLTPVPLSAASSMVLDNAIHGLLSESIDGLATTPKIRSKRSQSAIAPSMVGTLAVWNKFLCVVMKTIPKCGFKNFLFNEAHSFFQLHSHQCPRLLFTDL